MPTRRSLLTNLGLLGLLGGAAWLYRDRFMWPSATVAFDASDGVTPWLPFAQPQQSLVTLAVEVAGTRLNALIDSGAQYSVIDSGVAAQLALPQAASLPIVALGVGGGAQVARGVRFDLDLGGARFDGLKAASLNLGPLTSLPGGLATPLVLGWDVLSALAVEFDFRRDRLRIGQPGRIPAPPGAVTAPVRRRGRGLIADVMLEGRPLSVLVDTGSSGVLGLSRAAAEEAGLLGRKAIRQGQSLVLGGVAASQVVEARELVFAGETFRPAPVHIIDLPNVPGFPSGLLGIEALRRFRVLLDAGAGRLDLVSRVAPVDVFRGT